MGQVLTVDKRAREVRKAYDPDVETDISKIEPHDIVGRDRARRRIMHEGMYWDMQSIQNTMSSVLTYYIIYIVYCIDMVDKQSILILQEAVQSCYRQYGAQNAPYKCRDINIEYLRRIAHQSNFGGMHH